MNLKNKNLEITRRTATLISIRRARSIQLEEQEYPEQIKLEAQE